MTREASREHQHPSLSLPAEDAVWPAASAPAPELLLQDVPLICEHKQVPPPWSSFVLGILLQQQDINTNFKNLI